MSFIPQEQRKGGRWLKYLPPKIFKLLVVKDGKVRLAILNDEESTLLHNKIQRSNDDRCVGVYVKGGKLTVPGTDGQPSTLIDIPDSVAPIRAILGPEGQHNLEWMCEGKVITVLFPLNTLDSVDEVVIREDIPSYRDATLEKNFDPR